MTKLYLNDNKLTSIPDEIGNLVNLEELYLHQNKLTELPNSIGECTKLQTVDLSHNKLEALPSSMKNLKELQIVDLTGNKIAYAPEEIKRLHDKHALLHSRERRRELIRRALKVRTNVSISCQRELQSLALADEED
jgi:Leucine-rich repeat (LRR) protein